MAHLYLQLSRDCGRLSRGFGHICVTGRRQLCGPHDMSAIWKEDMRSDNV